MKNNIMKYITEKLSTIDNIEDEIKYTKQITEFLRTLHLSDAYIIIRDTIVPAKNKRIQDCKKLDIKVYQEFQALMQDCKESHNHDNAYATNLDVDKAVSKAYGISTRMIRAVMDMEKARFDKLTTAINKIEEHLGLDVTDFREDDKNDTTNNEDAQGIEEVTARTGEAGEAE